MVISDLTRNFLKSWLFAPLKKPVNSGVFSGSKIEYFVVLSVSSFQKFLEIMRNHIHGELSEWSKVQHSKCCVPKRNLGFESLTLRQKPSHIKAFAHMTGLFFSLKVTSAYMIFGKSSGVPAGLPCVRQSQDIVHYICRGDLGLVIQMAVNIRRRADVAVTQPLLDLLQRHIVCQKQ